MTLINKDELDQIHTIDQAIIWAIVSLNRSNKHPRNMWTSDNAAVRQEAEEFCNYQIIRDERGNGQFIFSANFPVVNPNPLALKKSIIECIYSANPFKLTDNQIDFSSVYKGLALPNKPPYVETLEQFVVWVCMVAAKALEIVRFVNTLIAQKKSEFPAGTPNIITGNSCIQIAINNNFYSFPIVNDYRGFYYNTDNLAGTADREIAQFDWSDIYATNTLDFSDNYIEIFRTIIESENSPQPADRLPIDTMPVCKEQDPKVANYTEKDLLSILNKQ